MKFVAKVLSMIAACTIAGAASYFVFAYEFVPSVWRFVERRHPALDKAGTRSVTAAGIPGDPLNVAFVGSEEALLRAMAAARWVPADPITWKSSIRIAVSSVARKPYTEAPVSDLLVNGKKQDLAFEQASSGDPSKRHHVRFWKMNEEDLLDRPLWVGAATYDSSVGLSRTTGQVTHHIAADIDQERDKLVADVERLEGVSIKWIDSFQHGSEGRNGGGDRYFTDRRLAVIEVEPVSPPPAAR